MIDIQGDVGHLGPHPDLGGETNPSFGKLGIVDTHICVELTFQGLFAAANIFSSLKLVYIFSVNPYLGPLQVRLFLNDRKNPVFLTPRPLPGLAQLDDPRHLQVLLPLHPRSLCLLMRSHKQSDDVAKYSKRHERKKLILNCF